MPRSPVWGANRVGLHLAPRGDTHSMGDSNLLATFTYVAQEARKRKLAFLMAREHAADTSIGPQLKKTFGGPYIVNEKFTPESAEEALRNGTADAVAFGKLFLANPDLPARIRTGAALNEPIQKLFMAATRTAIRTIRRCSAQRRSKGPGTVTSTGQHCSMRDPMTSFHTR